MNPHQFYAFLSSLNLTCKRDEACLQADILLSEKTLRARRTHVALVSRGVADDHASITRVSTLAVS